MNFSEALEQLKCNTPMTRKGWNAPHIIHLQTPDAHSKMTKQYFYINTVQGDLIPWTATNSDLLADDWEVVGKESRHTSKKCTCTDPKEKCSEC